MDGDNFRARVHKVFGSLSSSPSSVWSLTDDEVERKQWNRGELRPGKEDDDQTLCSSSYDGLFRLNRSAQLRNMNRGYIKDDGIVERNDVWEIKSSIGLDSTLDNEEEEDEYDRVAEGKDRAGDCLYVKNVIDQETSSDPSGHNICRDPRANHVAAQVRLKEDAEAAEKCETHFDGITLSGEHHSTKPLQNQCKVKPILKRTSKPENGGVKSTKRVRFGPSCKDECEGASELEVSWTVPASANSSSQENESVLGSTKPKVPDHVLNPSRYTHYSLDSSIELDDESNGQACSILVEEVKRSKHDQLTLGTMEVSGTNPKSVTFVPRQKNTSATAAKDGSLSKGATEDACNESLHPKGFPICIADGEAQQCEDPMEEDMDTHTADNVGSRKRERHYRSKSGVEDTVT